MADEKGVWRTVSGRRIFIRDGQSLEEAMQASGKFGRITNRETVRLEPAEYRKVMSEINTYYHQRFEEKPVASICTNQKEACYCYRFENFSFNNYRFINKYPIDNAYFVVYKEE